MVIQIKTALMDHNSYIITDNNISVIVDPGYNLNPKELIKQYNIKAVLLTHAHFDHILSAKDFNLPIYLNERELEFLFKPELSLFSLFGFQMPNFSDSKIITFKGDEVLEFNSLKIKCIHTPGHTIGSTCFYIEGHLITGDTLFKGTYGNYTFPTGDYNILMSSIMKLFYSLPLETFIYPGHGDISTLKDEKDLY